MKQPNFPHIVGFECYPQGRLLQQFVDFDRPVGIAYERCIGYVKPEHRHDRITVTFPRGASRSFIKTFPEEKSFRMDSSSAHWMAKDKPHEQGSYSAVYDTFALFPRVEVVKDLCSSLGIGRTEANTALAATVKVKRSRLVADALDRYFFHRIVSQQCDDATLSRLEREILAEVLAAVAGLDKRQSPTQVIVGPDGDLSKALEFIESNLFENIVIHEISGAARMSQATLFRRFKQVLKTTPFEYIRSRRLDESMALLKTGSYLVSDAAMLVGYEDLSAFSKAFKLRFKRTPSAVIPKERS